MDNKIIALIIVVVLIIAGGEYILGTQSGPANTTLATNNTTSNINTTTDNKTEQKNDTRQNSTGNMKISAAQAQKIAIGTAQELGGENDTAGTPTLINGLKIIFIHVSGMYRSMMLKPRKVQVHWMWIQ